MGYPMLTFLLYMFRMQTVHIIHKFGISGEFRSARFVYTGVANLAVLSRVLAYFGDVCLFGIIRIAQ